MGKMNAARRNLLVAAALCGCTAGTGGGGPMGAPDGWAQDGGAGPAPTPTAPPPVSSAWAFEHPSPQGNTLRGLWVAPSGTEGWAVGEAGAVVRIAAGQATRQGAGVTVATLRAVTGVGSDVVAVGDGGIVLRGRGGAFGAQIAGKASLHAVWAIGDTVYAAGQGNLAWQSSGGGPFRSEVLPGLSATGAVLAAAARDRDVYLVGTGGRVLHQMEGRFYVEADGMTGVDLTTAAILGEEAYAAGQGGVILRRDPRTGRWAQEHPAAQVITRAEVRGIFSVGPAGAARTYALCADGTLLSRGAMGWQAAPGVTGAGGARLLAAGGGQGGAMAVGEAGLVFTRGPADADPWQGQGRLTRAGILAVAADDAVAYAVTDDGYVLRRAGGAWSVDYAPRPAPGRPLLGVTLRGAEAYAVGLGGVILRRTDQGWLEEAYSYSGRRPDWKAVWARPGSAEVFAVGSAVTSNAEEEVAILRRSGGAWAGERADTLVTASLFAVTGNESEVLAAGTQGVVLRRAGTAWTRDDRDVTADVHILGLAAQGRDFVAVGTRGAVLRRTVDMAGRVTWTRGSVSGVSGTLNGVVLAGPDLWMVGADGVVVRQLGADSQLEASLFAGNLLGIARGQGLLFAVGSNGAVMRRPVAQ